MTNPVQDLLVADSMITTHDIKKQGHTVFLDNSIDEPSKYRELISILFGSNEGDVVNIFINSPGGRLDSAGAIIEGLKATSATVVGHVIGQCHSAASMIMLNCENVVVYDSAECMVHTASFGAGGSTGNVKSHVDFTHSQVESLLDQTYKHFLTDEELDDLKKGCEFYFNAEELRERIEMRSDAIDAEEAETGYDEAIETVEKAIEELQTQLAELKEERDSIEEAGTLDDEDEEEVVVVVPKKTRKPRKKKDDKKLLVETLDATDDE